MRRTARRALSLLFGLVFLAMAVSAAGWRADVTTGNPRPVTHQVVIDRGAAEGPALTEAPGGDTVASGDLANNPDRSASTEQALPAQRHDEAGSRGSGRVFAGRTPAFPGSDIQVLHVRAPPASV